MFTRRHWLLAAAASSFGPATQAQNPNWPSRPLKITVAYPPGGVSDVVARALAEQLAPRLGTAVVVENRAGASGTLGVNAVAKSPADGYSVVFSALSPLTLSPHLGTLPYDPLKDLVAVASVMYSPVLLAATPALPEADFKAMLARARQQPGRVRWATSGNGSLGHLILESISASAQINITHVPYKGGGQQITDGLGGQFEVLSVNASGPVLQHVRDGKLRILAVGAPQRLDALPNAPTLGELGFASANLSSRFGLFAAAGTPPAVLEKLNASVNAVLAQAGMRERLLAAECVAAPTSLPDFARIVTAEHQNMGTIVQTARIKAD